MKERPILFSGPMVRAILAGRKTQTRRVVGAKLQSCVAFPDADKFSPYGTRGDRLWVRETFCESPDGPYRATVEESGDFAPGDSPTWRPSIFMPRRICRLVLEVTEARVQRVQDISPEDAQAEGAWRSRNPAIVSIDPPEFSELWDSINGRRPGCSWTENPWVWCVSFKRIKSKSVAA